MSLWCRPYTKVMACRQRHFIATFGVSRNRWYRSLKNSCLKGKEPIVYKTYMEARYTKDTRVSCFLCSSDSNNVAKLWNSCHILHGRGTSLFWCSWVWKVIPPFWFLGSDGLWQSGQAACWCSSKEGYVEKDSMVLGSEVGRMVWNSHVKWDSLAMLVAKKLKELLLEHEASFPASPSTKKVVVTVYHRHTTMRPNHMTNLWVQHHVALLHVAFLTDTPLSGLTMWSQFNTPTLNTMWFSSIPGQTSTCQYMMTASTNWLWGNA